MDQELIGNGSGMDRGMDQEWVGNGWGMDQGMIQWNTPTAPQDKMLQGFLQPRCQEGFGELWMPNPLEKSSQELGVMRDVGITSHYL